MIILAWFLVGFFSPLIYINIYNIRHKLTWGSGVTYLCILGTLIGLGMIPIILFFVLAEWISP